MRNQLTIMTWNIQGRSPAEVELERALRAWEPDVVLLQEARTDELAAGVGAGWGTCVTWPDAGERPGMAILARRALEASGTDPAGVADGGRHRLAWVRLARPDRDPITVACVHLMAPPWPGTPGRRRTQRAAVGSWARDRAAAGDRVMIGGDFNTIDPSLEGLVDASASAPRPTWRPLAVGWMPPIVRIDAVFADPSVQPARSDVDDRYRRSDHCPLVVRLSA